MTAYSDHNIYGEFPTYDGLIQDYDGVEVLESDLQKPKVDLETILAIQSLGMSIHSLARTRLRSEGKKHGFSMLENTLTQEDEVYDGSLEEYMTFRVAKTYYDQWKMHIRFRQNELSQDKNRESYLEDYHFDWLKNGNRMAFYSLRSVTQGHGANSGVTVETFKDIHALTEDNAIELQERMIAHSDKVTLSMIGKLQF